ncbi:MAG: peptidoglycan DD-metalloendopeptidase family protein [Rhodospirillaceae bacterium]|nr:peptidoglycan DD-metalloendopeptidase family protein [Rhodospirillaceae bacterium]
MPRRDRPFLVALILLASCGVRTFAWAQAPVADPGVVEAQRLRDLESALKKEESEQQRLARQRDETARQLDAVRADMIAVAKDIQDQEYSLTVLENRLNDLTAEEEKLAGTLGLRDEQLQRVAGALQRLALRPSDALTLSPLKPDDAVRTAILLRAAAPSIQASTRALEAELSGLYRVRAEMVEQQGRVAVAAAGLIDKRRTLEKLTEEKSAAQATLSAAAEASAARARQLAAEATDLKELMASLAAEKARRREAERIAALELEKQKAKEPPAPSTAEPPRIVLKPPPGMDSPATAPEGKQVAALPAAPAAPRQGLPEDIRGFAEARGTMPFPVVGALSRRYGEGADEAAARSKGIVITARAGAPVVAPFDGVVAFAGPFRGYGLLLIIEHREGYHTLLAGLGRIDAAIDQRVFAGEPVGAMETEGEPDLYVELRHDGQPVNPLPWLASRTGKNSG